MTGVRLAVFGASGRMGRAVVRLAPEAGMRLVCALGASDQGRDAGELAGVGSVGIAVGQDLGALAASGAQVVVDFSAPSALPALADACAAAGVGIVSGTTGLDDPAKSALDRAAARVPVLWEPNMSVGVHVLSMLVERACAVLGAGFDVEVTETHHRAKVDAPSGTALRLAEVAKAARARAGIDAHLVHGRQGRPGPRSPDEIGMHALRGGDVIGDHTVFFFGEGERLELTHRASNRDLFARGALVAARAIAARPPGRYRLGDVLGV